MAKRTNTRQSQEVAKRDIYDDVTATIIADLEQGVVPWVMPWSRSTAKSLMGLPQNAVSDRRYSGINIVILWAASARRGFKQPRWLTFKQALDAGGCVRRGERATTVVYADRFIPDRERERTNETGDPKSIKFLKRFSVFNVEQCDGLAVTDEGQPPTEDAIAPEAERLITNSGATFRIGGPDAYYQPAGDYIAVPPMAAFADPINWHRTAFHELAHWSGAEHRLARDLAGRRGSPSYAREELVAEMTAAFVCASLGIIPTVRHADYLGSWLGVLREDKHAIFRAASAASKASDYLLAFAGERAIEQPPQSEEGGMITASRDAELQPMERSDAETR